MEEKTFFSQGGVVVTNSRFIVNGQTFAMNNITSVKCTHHPASRGNAFAFFCIAIVCLYFAPVWVSLIIAFLGFAAWKSAKDAYHIMLHTSGGETSALTSDNSDYIDEVLIALNNAIIHRG